MKIIISILLCIIGLLTTPSPFSALAFCLAGVFAHSADRDRQENLKAIINK